MGINYCWKWVKEYGYPEISANMCVMYRHTYNTYPLIHKHTHIHTHTIYTMIFKKQQLKFTLEYQILFISKVNL